jgi:TRAP-type C4-dicarboxylate transport system permease small subunit
MGRAEKILEVIVWLLILGSMGWLAYGCYILIDLFFLRG